MPTSRKDYKSLSETSVDMIVYGEIEKKVSALTRSPNTTIQDDELQEFPEIFQEVADLTKDVNDVMNSSKKVTDTWIMLSRHFVGLHKNVQMGYTVCSRLVGHTPHYNINAMLKETAEVFVDAVLWDKKDLSKLSESLAKLVFRLCHACAYYRGSAACMEYLVKAISEMHGYQLNIEPGSLDQVALAVPFESDFVFIFSRDVQFFKSL